MTLAVAHYKHALEIRPNWEKGLLALESAVAAQAAEGGANTPKPTARPHGHDAGDLGKLAAWVAAQQEGNRNDGLFWAACRAAEAGHGDLGDLVTAAVAAGLSEAEAVRTIASAARRAAG